MRWSHGLLSEEVNIRVSNFHMQNSTDGYELVFEVQYRVTPDEIKRAERESEVAPLEPPIRYGSAMGLVQAINTDEYPEGVEFDDLLRFMTRVGLQHLVTPRSYHEVGQSGGLEKAEAERILSAVFHKVRERTIQQLTTAGDPNPLKKANQIANSTIRAIVRPEYWGGDARAAKGQPGSKKFLAEVIPGLVKHFMEVSRIPVIQTVKGFFGVFPQDWQEAIFGPDGEYIYYTDMAGATHFQSKQPRTYMDKRVEHFNRKREQLERDIEKALSGERPAEDTRRWLTLYGNVTIPLGTKNFGFRGKFSEEFNKAAKSGHIVKVNEVDGRPVYRWDTGISGFGEWARRLDSLGEGMMTKWLNLILGSSNIELVDSVIDFHKKAKIVPVAPQAEKPLIEPPAEDNTPAQPEADTRPLIPPPAEGHRRSSGQMINEDMIRNLADRL